MKKIISVLLCALLSIAALAQSANMMSMARAELAKRGLNETEVRARLLGRKRPPKPPAMPAVKAQPPMVRSRAR